MGHPRAAHTVPADTLPAVTLPGITLPAIDLPTDDLPASALPARRAGRLGTGLPAAVRIAGCGLVAAMLAVIDVSTHAARAADEPLDALMRRLASRPRGHARFEELQYLSVLKTPLRSSGELVFIAPDHLEKITLAPRAESLVIDRGMLTMTRDKRTHTVALADYPQLAPFVESIRATLAGDRAALEKAYTVAHGSDERRWWMTLTPRDAALVSMLRSIRITGVQDAIRTMEILNANGDRSMMTITDLPTP